MEEAQAQKAPVQTFMERFAAAYTPSVLCMVVLGRRMVSLVRQNVAASLAIKAVFLAMAAAGYASLWMAVLADMGTTLLVIFNGLRLLRVRTSWPPTAVGGVSLARDV